jgi:putative DNA primase/helicase
MKLSIAIGKSRNQKNWKPKELTWAEFTAMLKNTVRTYESINEYQSFDKNRQAEIKDIGGFVSGKLAGNRRLKNSVLSKQIITLDVDDGTSDFWDMVTMQFDCAAFLYTTHKHTPEKPKYRLLIPLSEEVLKDEYEAVCRMVASKINIDAFDPTGYDVNRLMYWPSTSSDGEFFYREQAGEFLNPQEVLNLYADWKDIASWPQGIGEHKEMHSFSRTQGDPLEKPGLIGVFNNAYTITEAIETFLPDIYEPGEGYRFTYKLGSTYGGAVCYDEKFLYSHHSTDPISNKLCNAFDLVRIHKFGLEDNDEETPMNKRPSYLKMCDLVSSDLKCKKQIGLKVFSGITDEIEEVNTDWMGELDIDRKGNYLTTINNVALILEHDPAFKEAIYFDEFQQLPVFRKDVQWRKINAITNLITDGDHANMENYIEKQYKLKISTQLLVKGMLVVSERKRFHPVREFILSGKWDGVPRIDSLLIDYLGAEDSLYVRTVTRKTFAAAVARVFEPGIKYDYILTVVGAEGQGKSALWDKLGDPWFSDTFSLHMLKNKEAYEQIQSVWIIEIGELSGMDRAESERVKSFFAARKDRYRDPYGRTTNLKLRQCIFIASVNRDDFLKSQDGNRRFWPVSSYSTQPTKAIYGITKYDISQIWAEAYEVYQAGEPLFLNKEMTEIAVAIQSEHTEENPWVDIFENFLSYKIPENWYKISRFDKIEHIINYDPDIPGLETRTKVCKFELWEAALNKRDPLDSHNLKLIKQAMNKIKTWERVKDYVWFGNSYARHKGSYRPLMPILQGQKKQKSIPKGIPG